MRGTYNSFEMFSNFSGKMYQIILAICTIYIISLFLVNKFQFVLGITVPSYENIFLRLFCSKGVHVTQLGPVSNKLEYADISMKFLFLSCHFLLAFTQKLV